MPGSCQPALRMLAARFRALPSSCSLSGNHKLSSTKQQMHTCRCCWRKAPSSCQLLLHMLAADRAVLWTLSYPSSSVEHK